MKKAFEITTLNSPEFKARWEAETHPNAANEEPLKRILQLLESAPLDCRTVVFESNYVDLDYQDEFCTFYSRSFKTYPSRCTRVHFFGDNIPAETQAIDLANYAGAYLGFMVLRPIDLQRVGRTVLQLTTRPDDDEFINCQVPFASHILGARMDIKAVMPFIQQDTQVGTCAQASLWMLSRYMSKRFGYRYYLPGEINAFSKAKLSMGRALPAGNGLSTLQMIEALQLMGLPCVSYDKEYIEGLCTHLDAVFADSDQRKSMKLADIAYRYIESGLPVIFGTSDHALVGIGHRYDRNKNARVAIERIPAFYVNDDSRGPYVELPLLGASGNTFEDITEIITVSPVEVTLTGEMAEEMARAALDELLATKPRGEAFAYRDILENLHKDLVADMRTKEYRTYLMPSVEWQKQLRGERDAGSLPADLSAMLIEMDYPKYVWITEVSSPSLLNELDRHDRRCLGRAIVDTTAPAHTDGAIAVHYLDLVCRKNRCGAEIEVDLVEDAKPFPHKLFGRQ